MAVTSQSFPAKPKSGPMEKQKGLLIFADIFSLESSTRGLVL